MARGTVILFVTLAALIPVTTVADNLILALLIPGDADRDMDVDQEDFGHLKVCLGTSVLQPITLSCQDVNFDGDNDVDEEDSVVFVNRFSGAHQPASPDCGNLW